jgi:hypothetical protein
MKNIHIELNAEVLEIKEELYNKIIELENLLQVQMTFLGVARILTLNFNVYYAKYNITNV